MSEPVNQQEIIQLSFEYFSVAAVIFVMLSALFGEVLAALSPILVLNLLPGAYFVLTILANWATYKKANKASVRLRLVTVLLCVND